MPLIPLTMGKYATVDESDCEWLSQWKWTAAKRGRHKEKWYAYRQYREGGKSKCVYMHRAILSAPSCNQIDHVNGDGLDNRRSNLRATDFFGNAQNHPKRLKAATSKFKGVHWDSAKRKWIAKIKANHKNVYLGSFVNEADAAEAYSAAAANLHGRFANTQISKLVENVAG